MPNLYVNKVVQSNGTTLIDISDTTAAAADVAPGKYFYLASGEKAVGASSGGSPSQSQHAILFEFTDETTQSITGYWDSSFISDAITATTPTEYGGKTVNSASLDSVAWYTRPTAQWETLYDGNNVNFYPDKEPPAYCWITDLGDIWPSVGSVWRITFDGVMYDNLIAKSIIAPWNQREQIIIGNAVIYGEEFEDTGEPFVFYNIDYGAWSGGVEGPNVPSTHTLKIERLVA